MPVREASPDGLVGLGEAVLGTTELRVERNTNESIEAWHRRHRLDEP